MGQNWKAGGERGLKRAILSSEKSPVISAGVKVESLRGSDFIQKRALLWAPSCLLFVVLAGLGAPAPKRLRGKLDVSFAFTCLKSVFPG